MNAFWCILLGISLVAIIVVLAIFLVKQLKDKPGTQNGTVGSMDTESAYWGTEPGTQAGQISSDIGTQAPVTIPTGEVIMPSTSAVQNPVTLEYDFNGDGVAENVNVAVNASVSQAMIGAGSLGTLSVGLEPLGSSVAQYLKVMGIRLKDGNRLAAVEYTYGNGTMGLVKVHVWKYENNGFVKTSEITYSGLIGNQGFMDSGVIQNNVPNDMFRYVAEENKNGYITERSRALADMKDLGIKLPFETIGAYTIGFDDNITFFYDGIVQ